MRSTKKVSQEKKQRELPGCLLLSDFLYRSIDSLISNNDFCNMAVEEDKGGKNNVNEHKISHMSQNDANNDETYKKIVTAMN